jgi:endonuclease G
MQLLLGNFSQKSKKLSLVISCFFIMCGARADFKQVEYQDFTIWMDCEKNIASMYSYLVDRDSRLEVEGLSLKADPGAGGCQAKTTDPYPLGVVDGNLSRSLMVNPDFLAKAPAEASFMTNVVPMQKSVLDGPWAETENLIACWREKMPLRVMGGAIWDQDTYTPRVLAESHDILLPSKYWKVVQRRDSVLAWIFPNKEIMNVKADNYLVSVGEIEALIGTTIPVPEFDKANAAVSGWPVEGICKKR